MPTNSVPKMGANLGPIKRNFDVQVRLHFWGGLGAMWRHRALFWRPKLGSLLGGPSWPTIHFIIIFLLESNQKWIVGQLGPPQQRAQLGPPKNLPVAPKAPQPPLKNGPQLGSQKLDLGRLSCGPIWAPCWRPRGAETIFFERPVTPQKTSIACGCFNNPILIQVSCLSKEIIIWKCYFHNRKISVKN